MGGEAAPDQFLVIPSYHTQNFFYSADTARGKIIDDQWNLAGALGELSNVNVTYFEYKCRRNVNKPWWARANTVLDIVIGMLTQKKATGPWVMTISDRLGDYIERNGIVLHIHQSVARQVHTFWIATRASKSAEEKAATSAKLSATHANRSSNKKAARATKLPWRANLRKNSLCHRQACYYPGEQIFSRESRRSPRLLLPSGEDDNARMGVTIGTQEVKLAEEESYQGREGK